MFLGGPRGWTHSADSLKVANQGDFIQQEPVFRQSGLYSFTHCVKAQYPVLKLFFLWEKSIHLLPDARGWLFLGHLVCAIESGHHCQSVKCPKVIATFYSGNREQGTAMPGWLCMTKVQGSEPGLPVSPGLLCFTQNAGLDIFAEFPMNWSQLVSRGPSWRRGCRREMWVSRVVICIRAQGADSFR